MPERRAPDDPREWLSRARSSLTQAKLRHPEIYLEDLCFNAQQAAEKAIKAILISLRVSFPYVHDLAHLVTLVERAGVSVPHEVREAEKLTRFAVFARYPTVGPAIPESEYQEALASAEAVVEWASRILAERHTG